MKNINLYFISFNKKFIIKNFKKKIALRSYKKHIQLN